MPPGTMLVNTNWSPTDSAMSRPAFFRRSWSGVFGIAFSMPVIEIGIRACWMKHTGEGAHAGAGDADQMNIQKTRRREDEKTSYGEGSS